ncbi:MAG TPA: dTMP kinase [Planctomycetota bacterium]|nr:dTMP kinase [Planctomycetota bacterium]
MTPAKRRGVFIAIEGPDGAGKSTQAAMLAERIEREARLRVVRVREPGGTPTGERVREVLLDPKLAAMCPWTELLLYMASRAQLVEEVIRPALAAGHAVVSDRFLLSSVVYQGYAGAIGPRPVLTLARAAFKDCLPDLTVVVDVPAAEGLSRSSRRRRGARGGKADRVEAKGLAYAEKVRAGFLDAAKRRLAGRSVILDGRAPAGEVAEDIWHEVRRVL